MKRVFRIIIIGFSLSFLVMAALSFYSIRQFTTLTNYSDQVDRANTVIPQLYKMESLIKELDARERAYMITGDSMYVTELYVTVKELLPVLAGIKDLTYDNPRQQQSVTMLGSCVVMRIANIKDNIELYSQPGVDSAENRLHLFDKGRAIRNESINYLQKMRDYEYVLLNERSENKKYYQQVTAKTIRTLLTVFGIMTLVLFLFMMRQLRKRMSFQHELQARLVDLEHSHGELEQIAFAASHDLQEPLRKIRVFSDRLLWLKKPEQEQERAAVVARITQAAESMQSLIEDMANLTGLAKNDAEAEPVDLNNVTHRIISDLNAAIEERGALIHREVLPTVKGYQKQLHLLFSELLDNALKFCNLQNAPIINIRADRTNGEELIHINKSLAKQSFHRITVSDNGIGFDNRFTDKIFQMFQRLHNDEEVYKGKGIGLAICQRVMANHNGYILGYGHPASGATFKLFFPIEEL